MAETSVSKIKFSTWMILIGVGIFFDILGAVISLIPVAGEILSIFIDASWFGILWLVHKMHGENYSKGTMIFGSIIGLIPIVNILPECTLTVVKLYFDAKAKNILAKVPGGQMAGTSMINKNRTNAYYKQADSMKKFDSNYLANRPKPLNIKNTPKQNNISGNKNIQPQHDPLEKEHAKIREENERKYREGTKDPTIAYREEMNKFYGRETPKENKPDIQEVMRKEDEKRRSERDRKWKEGTKDPTKGYKEEMNKFYGRESM